MRKFWRKKEQEQEEKWTRLYIKAYFGNGFEIDFSIDTLFQEREFVNGWLSFIDLYIVNSTQKFKKGESEYDVINFKNAIGFKLVKAEVVE